ncbi:MAG: GNAT family N-acetyltransferase [Promethearchaeota archaeon]
MYEGELVRIRAFELSDLDKILETFNNYKMRRYLDAPFPISRGQEEEWIKNAWKAQTDGTGYYFAVENKDTYEFLGSTALDNVSYVNRSAHLGIAIFNPINWNKGYGTDCLKILLSFGFEILNLHSIYLRVFDFNERAIKVYLKIGFKKAGVLREAYFIEGKYHDVILMDILANQFRQKFRKALEK